MVPAAPLGAELNTLHPSTTLRPTSAAHSAGRLLLAHRYGAVGLDGSAVRMIFPCSADLAAHSRLYKPPVELGPCGGRRRSDLLVVVPAPGRRSPAAAAPPSRSDYRASVGVVRPPPCLAPTLSLASLLLIHGLTSVHIFSPILFCPGRWWFIMERLRFP